MSSSLCEMHSAPQMAPVSTQSISVRKIVSKRHVSALVDFWLTIYELQALSYELLYIVRVTSYFLHACHELLIIEWNTSFFQLVKSKVRIWRVKLKHNMARARSYKQIICWSMFISMLINVDKLYVNMLVINVYLKKAYLSKNSIIVLISSLLLPFFLFAMK